MILDDIFQSLKFSTLIGVGNFRLKRGTQDAQPGYRYGVRSIQASWKRLKCTPEEMHKFIPQKKVYEVRIIQQKALFLSQGEYISFVCVGDWEMAFEIKPANYLTFK